MKIIIALICVWATLFLAGCDVKDPIYNTPHPDHGTVPLTTDWSDIGTGLPTPESYTVTATRDGSATAGYTATLTASPTASTTSSSRARTAFASTTRRSISP